MFFKTLNLFVAFATLTNWSVTADHGLHDEIHFQESPVKMPFKVSDIQASYVPGENGDEDAFIIITGGCDAEKGNERANFGDGDLFACLSTTDRTLKFDPFDMSFTELKAAPHPRQRHAAVVYEGLVYVFGGRDNDDNLVAAIDVSKFQHSSVLCRSTLVLLFGRSS